MVVPALGRRGAERRCVNKSQSAAASLRDDVSGGRVVYRGFRSLRDPAVAFPLLPLFQQEHYSWRNGLNRHWSI